MRIGRSDIDPLSLHPELERWAREQGWVSLHAFQEQARELILGSNSDMIITASTAHGKTEATFLPLLTLASRRRTGVSFVCVAPSKPLINDQFRRLLVPATRVRVPIWKWHGDASYNRKNKLLRDRLGAVLITPESLEGLLLRHARIVEDLFSNLDAIVIDEFHEFLQGPRGAQLGSLLSRIDNLVERPPRRIALSATLADTALARRYLRPQDSRAVKVVKGSDERQRLQSYIRGYLAPPVDEHPNSKGLLSAKAPVALRDIQASMYNRLRVGTHIVFAGSRRNVESLCDGLAGRCERAQVRNPFIPHHGSMAKGDREDAEQSLRSGTPLTAISTTTLGSGVDIGSVDSVEVIGAPTSLTTFRQNIGRSGRRDAPARVCLHITEHSLCSAIKLSDRLRLSTVRACAAFNLLERRFFELPVDDGTLLSVVFQQVLSIIKQRNGVLFPELLNSIQSAAAFHLVSEKMLKQMLDHLISSEAGFIERTRHGRYVLTEKGGKLVHSNEFYASFRTTDQWEIVAEDRRKVGTMSLANALAIGSTYCLGGRAWEVKHLDVRHYRAIVVPALSGAVPIFDTAMMPEVHEDLAQEMRRVLDSEDFPLGLDRTASAHLQEGRATFKQFELRNQGLVASGDLCHVMSWKGTRFNKLLVEVLRAKGFVCSADEAGVTIASTEPNAVAAALTGELPSLNELASNVAGIYFGKHDRHIPERLLRDYWAIRQSSLQATLHAFCGELHAAARTGRLVESR